MASDSDDPLKQDVGANREGEAVVVDADRVARFAEATGEPVTMFEEGAVVPPVYAAIASLSSHGRLLADVVRHEVAVLSIHVGQTMTFHRPIRVGTTVTSHATLAEVRSGPFGCALTMFVEVFGDGSLAVEGYHRVLLRSVRTKRVGGEVPPPAAPRRGQTELGRLVFDIADDQSVRYARASGDLLPVHTDPVVAKAAGFPGLILHGMCTFAMCGRAALDLSAGGPGRGDSRSLRMLSASFKRPVVCGQRAEVRGVAGDRGSVHLSVVQQGRSAVRDAWALVGDA